MILAVGDLAAAADELAVRHGLAAVEGGRHPGWGTANRIVPLGETYLELIAVVDPDEAAASEFGRWVASTSSAGETTRLLGWAVRTHDLDGVARRLGLAIGSGSRAAPDGSQLRWRSAGIEQAHVEPSLPFFLEWDPASTHPGRSAPAQPATIARVGVRGDPARLARWLGDHALALEVEPGPPELARVVLATPHGDVVLGL